MGGGFKILIKAGKFMWYNKNDEIILEPFYKELHKHLHCGQNIFRFYFDNGLKLIVKYDCEADSDNGLDLEDKNYEEFYEIYFEILKVEKKPKESKLRKGKYIEINYHNLPIKWEMLENIDKK